MSKVFHQEEERERGRGRRPRLIDANFPLSTSCLNITRSRASNKENSEIDEEREKKKKIPLISFSLTLPNIYEKGRRAKKKEAPLPFSPRLTTIAEEGDGSTKSSRA